MPAKRTTGLWTGAEAASNPECREEGRGGCCGGLSRSRGVLMDLHLVMSQARQNLTVSQTHGQRVNQTS